MRSYGSLLLIALFISTAAPASAEEPGYVVVVHPENPSSSIARAKLSDLFLGKAGSWESGQSCKPVDQSSDSPVRKAFSESVLKRSVFAVVAFWQQRVFSGRGAPPPQMGSDEEVAAYVRANRDSVGYLSPKANRSGLKVLEVLP